MFSVMSTKTVKKVEVQTRMFIVQAIKDIVSDPDIGLKLTPKATTRLRQAARAGERKTTALADIRKKYL